MASMRRAGVALAASAGTLDGAAEPWRRPRIVGDAGFATPEPVGLAAHESRRWGLPAWVSARALAIAGFGGVVLLGALVRIFKLDHLSLWLDEGFTVLYSRQEWAAVSGSTGFYSPHPPLYFTLVKVSDLFFPDELAGRLISVAAAIATIPVFYRLIAMVLDRRAAFVACLVLALSPIHALLRARGADVRAGGLPDRGFVPGTGVVSLHAALGVGRALWAGGGARALGRLLVDVRARPAGDLHPGAVLTATGAGPCRCLPPGSSPCSPTRRGFLRCSIRSTPRTWSSGARATSESIIAGDDRDALDDGLRRRRLVLPERAAIRLEPLPRLAHHLSVRRAAGDRARGEGALAAVDGDAGGRWPAQHDAGWHLGEPDQPRVRRAHGFGDRAGMGGAGWGRVQRKDVAGS